MPAFDYKFQQLAPIRSFKSVPEDEQYLPGHRTHVRGTPERLQSERQTDRDVGLTRDK